MSFLLENLGLVLIGGRPKTFPPLPLVERILKVGDVRIPILSVWVLVITVVLLVLVILVVHRTKIGIAMRALSRDMETVRLVGRCADRVISFTFVSGFDVSRGRRDHVVYEVSCTGAFHGRDTGLKAFVAAVLGGIGSVGGAAIGGDGFWGGGDFIVAIEPQWSGYRDAIAFHDPYHHSPHPSHRIMARSCLTERSSL